MKKIEIPLVSKCKFIFSFYFLFFFFEVNSQSIAANPSMNFWNEVQYGGGVGMNFSSGYTEITLAPSAVYPLNKFVSLGAGLIGSYTNSRNYFSTSIYGLSAISLFNPLNTIQLSIEVEQAKVRSTVQMTPNSITRNYWNTGLFVGAGYRNGNVTVGARYNLLFDKDKSINSDALMPFVRFYF
jgi:hypothetical protein